MTTRKTSPFVSLVLLVLLATQASARLPPYSLAYDPARDPFADGRAAIDLAARTGRNVLIEVGGEWCSWCHVLERTINEDPELRQLMADHFVLLKVNVSDENDNADFLKGMPDFTGYPHIFVADDKGSILHSQDVSRWLVNGRYSTARIKMFFMRWRPQRERRI